jgi:hypothetical protein
MWLGFFCCWYEEIPLIRVLNLLLVLFVLQM